LVKHQVNKMVKLGIYAAPKNWEPYDVKESVLERIKKTEKKSSE